MNRWFPALTLLAVFAFLACFWVVRDFTCDDAGISFCYARSLSEGRGLVLTPGSERAEGYSNLLWVALLAAGLAQGFDAVLTAKSLAVAAGIATVVMLAFLPSRLASRSPRPFDILPCLLFATSLPHVFWTAGALETSLYTALLVGALLSFTSELGRKDPFPASAVLLFAASVTRPEGPLAFLLVLPAVAACRSYKFAPTLEWFLACALPYASFTLWRAVYFGSWLPTVYHAKMPSAAAAGLAPGSAGWSYVAHFSELYWPWYLFVLASWGLVRLAREPLARWVTGSATASLLFVLLCGGDWMQHFRMLVPALPFLLLGLHEGITAFATFVFSPYPIRMERSVSALLTALVALGAPLRIAIPQLLDLAASPGHYRVTFESRVARGKAYAALASQANLTGGVLAEPDAGGTAWASGLDLLDLTGLTDRTLCRYRSLPRIRDEYLFEQRRPTFLRLHGGWGEATGLAGHREISESYIQLPPLPGNQPTDRDHVRRDIFIAGPSERTELPMACSFGGEIRLAGISRVARFLGPGGRFELLLYWRRGTPSSGTHTIRVGLHGPTHLSFDHHLASGWLPADQFRSGELIRERRTLELPKELPEGHYDLTIAVFAADGRELEPSTKMPSNWGVKVARLDARRHVLELADTLLALESRPPDSRTALWHRMRQMELSATMTEAELIRMRHRSAIEVLRRGIQEVENSSRPLEQRVPEAAACLLQARLWGNDGRVLEGRLVAVLSATARRLAASKETMAALRWMALAARIAPSNPEVLAARDALWEPFSRQ